MYTIIIAWRVSLVMIMKLTVAQMQTKTFYVNFSGTSANAKILHLKNGRYVYKEKERREYVDMPQTKKIFSRQNVTIVLIMLMLTT